MSDARRLVDKLWSFCNVLRDDGVSTIEYTEQLTFLLFLKMAHERETRPLKPERIVPVSCSWQRLLNSDGDELEVTYRHMLEELARQPGTLGVIFRKAQNRIQDPAKLKRLIVDLIDRENWSAAGVDIKGDAYEELLAKGAEDIKSGAGQYFTPRALIAAMVDCSQPSPADTVVDPACGTGGFLLAAHAYAARDAEDLDPDVRNHLRDGFIRGTEFVDGTARLAAMNLLLHGIGQPVGDPLIQVGDALTSDPGDRYSVVLANPPFGLHPGTWPAILTRKQWDAARTVLLDPSRDSRTFRQVAKRYPLGGLLFCGLCSHRLVSNPLGAGQRGLQLVIDPVRSRLVREACTRVTAGDSLAGICKDWAARGLVTSTGVPWRPQGIRKMLVRPSTTGMTERQGKQRRPREVGRVARGAPSPGQESVRWRACAVRASSGTPWLSPSAARCSPASTTCRPWLNGGDQPAVVQSPT